jgi:glycosyltransferase involved in cell wall biosynthesis
VRCGDLPIFEFKDFIVKDTPLLSVIIPTRNRPDALKYAVNSALDSLNGLDFEIIIASNGDSKASDLEFLSPDTISKLIIVRNKNRLSMSHNWKFGYEAARGRWIHFQGDDDLILECSIETLTNLLESEHSNGILFDHELFDWVRTSEGSLRPGPITSRAHDNSTNRLHVSRNQNWRTIQPREFPTGAAHSLVRRTWLEKINQSNALFNSISPDWYNGAIFAMQESEFLRVGIPWSAIGNHPNSSIAQMKSQFVATLDPISKSAVGSQELFQRVGDYFPTTWRAKTDALIQAHKYVHNTQSVDFRHLVAKSYETTPRYVLRVFRIQRQKFPEYGLLHFFWASKELLRATFVAIRNRLSI